MQNDSKIVKLPQNGRLLHVACHFVALGHLPMYLGKRVLHKSANSHIIKMLGNRAKDFVEQTNRIATLAEEEIKQNGAVMCDSQGVCFAIGVILDGEASD